MKRECFFIPQLKFCRALLPLRLLLLRRSEPEAAEKVFRLMDHNAERERREPEVWRHYQRNVVGYLLEGAEGANEWMLVS